MYAMLRLAGGFLLVGAAVVAVDRLTNRAPVSGEMGGGSSRPGSYFELMKMRARRKQDRKLAQLRSSRDREAERNDPLAAREERAEDLARETERYSTKAARRGEEVQRILTRTMLNEQEASERYAAPDAASGLLYVGKIDERGELKAAKLGANVAEKDRRSAAQSKKAAQHDLRSARLQKRAGTGDKDNVKAAKKALQESAEMLKTRRFEEKSAEQTVRKEQAELAASRRQSRAREVEKGIEQSLTTFQADPRSEVYDATKEAVYQQAAAADLYGGT